MINHAHARSHTSIQSTQVLERAEQQLTALVAAVHNQSLRYSTSMSKLVTPVEEPKFQTSIDGEDHDDHVISYHIEAVFRLGPRRHLFPVSVNYNDMASAAEYRREVDDSFIEELDVACEFVPEQWPGLAVHKAESVCCVVGMYTKKGCRLCVRIFDTVPCDLRVSASYVLGYAREVTL